jgi:hypothetical protein
LKRRVIMADAGYTKEEIARRGQERYDREIRSKVEEGNKGKIVMIDIETGDYTVSDDQLAAAHAMLAKHPGALLYAVRIGYPTLGKIGGNWGKPEQ